MARKVKFIVAESLDRLEIVVNGFLANRDNESWYSDFKPFNFGHEKFVMVFDKQDGDTN